MAQQISFEEAKEIAKRFGRHVDRCQEYTEAYWFYKDYGEIYMDGGDQGKVILKKDGKVLLPCQFFLGYDGEVEQVGEEFVVNLYES